MKTLTQATRKVEAIKRANFKIIAREIALNEAGYEFCEMSAQDAEQMTQDGKIVIPVSCSRDWNKTYGYAVLK